MDKELKKDPGCDYCEHISNIKNGDLLIWSESNDKAGFFSDILLKLVRLMTLSDYGHVGIALWLNDRLFVIEAVSPRIRLIPLARTKGFYHMPVGLEWKNWYTDWLLDKVGIPYSFSDAIRAYLGKEVLKDGHMQCVELANEFYTFTNTHINAKRLTPSSFVEAIHSFTGKGIYKVSAYEHQIF